MNTSEAEYDYSTNDSNHSSTISISLDEAINNPESFLDFSQRVITAMRTRLELEKLSELQGQQNAVSKAISELDRQNIEVPDGLRAEKIRLTLEIDRKRQLQNDFYRFLKQLSSQSCSASADSNKKELSGSLAKVKSTRRLNVPPETTPLETMQAWAMQALRDLGGSGYGREIRESLWHQHGNELTAADLRKYPDGKYSWTRRLRSTLEGLRSQGILLPRTEPGFWKLAEESE